ncbi:MAG: hypothetical protein QW356_07330 [Candidatus Hadarchaeales archaeon]
MPIASHGQLLLTWLEQTLHRRAVELHHQIGHAVTVMIAELDRMGLG